MFTGTDFVLVPVGLATGIVGVLSGGASLVSFPALLALGYSPLAANTTNTVALPFLSLGGCFGYRKELARNKEISVKLTVAGLLGGLVGAILLLALGARVFKLIVPALLIFGAATLLLQPRLNKFFARNHEEPTDRERPAIIGTGVGSIYGGYFGPGLGTVLTGLYSTFLVGGMQRAIALKNIGSIASNFGAAVLFCFFAPVHFKAAAILAVFSCLGGYVGSHIAGRLPDNVLRYMTVVIAIVAAGYATTR